MAAVSPQPVIFTGAAPEEVWPLVRAHHYSCRMPSNIQHCYAIREPGGLFGDTGDVVAAIVFSIPPTRWAEDVLELSRLVRSPACNYPMSALISYACGQLKKKKRDLLVSFADWTQRHHGGVYQASGWQYGGQRESAVDGLVVNGAFVPGRSCNSRWGTRSADKLTDLLPDAEIEPHWDHGKHLYWKHLSIAGHAKAKRLDLLSLPYPKPNAARPQDERLPSRPSVVQPHGAAPFVAPTQEAFL